MSLRLFSRHSRVATNFVQRSGLHQSVICRKEQPVSSASSAPAEQSPVSTAAPTNDLAEKQAEHFLNSLPGKDKAYTALIGTSMFALALGKELVPYTAEVVFAVPFSIVMYLGFKYGGPALSGLKDKIVAEREKIWFDAKTRAESQLETKIHEITGSGITDLVEVTNQLFDHAEDLTKMEAKAFEHEQNLAFHTKAKQILDEWVRFETAEREREQRRISEEVIAKVMEAVNDPKFQERYLEQCIGDIEHALAK